MSTFTFDSTMQSITNFTEVDKHAARVTFEVKTPAGKMVHTYLVCQGPDSYMVIATVRKANRNQDLVSRTKKPARGYSAAGRMMRETLATFATEAKNIKWGVA